MKNAMIRTIVFDIGQVLVQFRYMDYLRDLGFDEEMSEKIARATVLSKWWMQVDLGEDIKTIKAGIIGEHPELKDQLELFFAHTYDIVKLYDYSCDWLRELKEQGYRIYLLSNYGNQYFHEQMPHFKFRKYVDGELISYQVGKVKPDARIYEILFERFAIHPEEAVFIDDNEQNIQAARDAGMKGIIFTGYEQAKEELEKLGVSCFLGKFSKHLWCK